MDRESVEENVERLEFSSCRLVSLTLVSFVVIPFFTISTISFPFLVFFVIIASYSL